LIGVLHYRQMRRNREMPEIMGDCRMMIVNGALRKWLQSKLQLTIHRGK
jgi:hypothetical protein